MALSFPIHRAGQILRSGGVVAYPTEGVFGLGCIPDYADAVIRILSIKKRDPSLGLVLIASNMEQLEDWLEVTSPAALRSSPDRPVTWIVPARTSVPYWLQGDNDGLAVRLTTHAVAAALCVAADSALVSTSANVAGRPPARNALVLRRQLGGLVDCIVPGRCGPAAGPSEIRDLKTGKVLRPGR
ncbi:MAG: L-threonylcarbamoyladenylate synthase [Woeseia sp.]